MSVRVVDTIKESGARCGFRLAHGSSRGSVVVASIESNSPLAGLLEAGDLIHGCCGDVATDPARVARKCTATEVLTLSVETPFECVTVHHVGDVDGLELRWDKVNRLACVSRTGRAPRSCADDLEIGLDLSAYLAPGDIIVSIVACGTSHFVQGTKDALACLREEASRSGEPVELRVVRRSQPRCESLANISEQLGRVSLHKSSGTNASERPSSPTACSEQSESSDSHSASPAAFGFARPAQRPKDAMCLQSWPNSAPAMRL
jgi:hypothetical protein